MQYNENLCFYQFSRDWDLHNFGVLNKDIMSLDMESGPLSLDLSSGYLQDVVDDWINHCKRRRLHSNDPFDQMAEFSKNCSNSDDHGYPFENFSCLGLKSLISENSDGPKKVAYPFVMVKPIGIEGDVTLNEINKRIKMRPKRPVKHPVGDLVCNPIVSANGFGPSGKAVVALTRIRTQGRGTITIIKTRD